MTKLAPESLDLSMRFKIFGLLLLHYEFLSETSLNWELEFYDQTRGRDRVPADKLTSQWETHRLQEEMSAAM